MEKAGKVKHMVQSHTQRTASWKWWITGLLLLATTINYMDRVTLTTASVRLTSEMKLSEAQYGHLELAFGWAFAVGSLVFGFLADRMRVYLLYPAILAGWSIMGLLTGWVESFSSLIVCRTLLGFFEAGHWPCALKTTFAILDEKDRTMGNSILQSGASIGAVLIPQVAKLFLTHEPGSWRTLFIVVGASGFIWIVLWFAFLRSRDLERQESTVAAKEPSLSLCHYLLSGRFWAVAMVITGAQTVWHIYRVWHIKFLQTGRGYTETEAFNISSMYYICTDVGCFLAGLATLWLVRKQIASPHSSRRLVYMCACLLTSLSVLIPWLDKGWPLLITLMLIGAGALALFPCYYSFVQEISSEHVGRLTGILSMYVWGVTSPLHSLFGMMADNMKAHDVTKTYDMGLVIAGLAPWLGVIALALLWKKGPNRPH